jgi:predicted CXXCH cytochrome family protein
MGGTKLPTFDQKWTGPTKYCLSCHDGSVASGDVNWYKGGKACFSKSGCPSAGFGQTSAINVGFGGKMDGNHPVAVPYPYGQAKNTYNSTTSGDGVVLAEYAADPTADGIRLFNDTGAANGVVAGTAAGSTGMECTSCHDVHNGSGVQGDFLLRGTLNGDSKPYLCLKCHLKP